MLGICCFLLLVLCLAAKALIWLDNFVEGFKRGFAEAFVKELQKGTRR